MAGRTDAVRAGQGATTPATTRREYIHLRSAAAPLQKRNLGGAATCGSRATPGAVTPAATRCEYIHVRSAAASLRPRVVARITAPCPNVLDRVEPTCGRAAAIVCGRDSSSAPRALTRSLTGFDGAGPRGLRSAATLGRRDAAAEPTGTYLRRVAAVRRPLGSRLARRARRLGVRAETTLCGRDAAFERAWTYSQRGVAVRTSTRCRSLP
ncbi:MAG: hypothetical protein NFCOHLIN_02286 [Gammaproteobacteria bacterium]|nr:hypothetical protein [Gammaproteobacteria bacterium]